MNYTKELLAMTSDEAFMFDILMDCRDVPDLSKPYIKTNKCNTKGKFDTPLKKSRASRGYKKLKAKNLVIRASRNNYIINPELVITNDMYYSIDLADYLSVKNRDKIDE